RHERPQKGRFRQFNQIGVEAYGMDGPDIDLEVILISNRIWQALGLNGLELQINTLGTSEERVVYRQQLVEYLSANREQLDEESLRRLQSNPLRILDSKNSDMRELIAEAPALMDYLGDESKAHFKTLCDGLDQVGVAYVVNPRLVRGLDYYSRTVFEWVTDQLGAQGTVCAGGRYDGLVEQLGGRKTPAVGFAMGVERLISLLEESETATQTADIHAYMVLVGEEPQRQGLLLAEQLRDQMPGLRLLTNCGGGSFKSQFKKADRSGASYALVIGEDELNRGVAGVKPLRDKGEQQEISLDSLGEFFRDT
ncbi:MAG: histidine--tRNA ligase, partial [Gammaproteobacteria bacterium]|nr:histidine--tRNA ligase [Gammaproteobacteria bacterium]